MPLFWRKGISICNFSSIALLNSIIKNSRNDDLKYSQWETKNGPLSFFSCHESLFLIFLLRKCVEQWQCEKRFHIVGSYGQNQLVVGSELTNMNSANWVSTCYRLLKPRSPPATLIITNLTLAESSLYGRSHPSPAQLLFFRILHL